MCSRPNRIHRRAAGAGAVTGEASPPSGVFSLRNFYATEGMTEAERIELVEAHGIEGLEHEIALLRVRLKAAINDRPEDLKLLTHGVQTLVRAVAVQYRLSPKARKDLADNLAAVLNSFGDQILPADSR